MSDNFQAKLFEEDTGLTSGAAPDNVMRVLVPYPVGKAYDYAVPDGLSVQQGDYVTVPFSGREIAGVVWGEASADVKPAKLKEMVATHDIAPMPAIHRKFVDWVAQYTMSAKGAVLKMSLSAPAALDPPKPIPAYRLKVLSPGERAIKLSPKQQAVVDVMKDGQIRRAAEIAEAAGCTAGVVKTLMGKDILEPVALYNPAPCKKPDPYRDGPALSESQNAAASRMVEQVEQGGFHASLLDGVTGAGKTETYFEAVAAALKRDKQVLILLPEIALSNAFLKRFSERFGCAPALWHSNLSPAKRRETWRGVAMGDTKVVVGARSALFLPYPDLGLIIVDEEHDPAFKQEEGVIYHARDMAVVRAHLGGFPIALVSATPSLETMANCWADDKGNARYEYLHLPSRFGGAQLPEIEMIDLREDKPEASHFIAPSLKIAVAETLQKGEQALLFLNRRGYAPLTLCRTCGHRMECPRCSAWLVEHKSPHGSMSALQCHHCGFSQRIPKECPECNDTDSMAACGPGVERIYDEAKMYFPDARIKVLASDTAENNEELRAIIDEIREGEIDLIIGTQIIAKGHHFPNLTLVGVIDADLGLQGGELRASERTYQLLHQVAGRAGRAEKPGKVYLQSFMPDHRIMKALCQFQGGESAGTGRDSFLEVEALERQAAHMPPYSRLAGIIVSGREEGQVIEAAKLLGRTAPQSNNGGQGAEGLTIRTLGPAPAPFARLRGKYRYRLLVMADKDVNIQKAIETWLAPIKTPSAVRIQIDIDPQSFL